MRCTATCAAPVTDAPAGSGQRELPCGADWPDVRHFRAERHRRVSSGRCRDHRGVAGQQGVRRAWRKLLQWGTATTGGVARPTRLPLVTAAGVCLTLWAEIGHSPRPRSGPGYDAPRDTTTDALSGARPATPRGTVRRCQSGVLGRAPRGPNASAGRGPVVRVPEPIGSYGMDRARAPRENRTAARAAQPVAMRSVRVGDRRAECLAGRGAWQPGARPPGAPPRLGWCPPDAWCDQPGPPPSARWTGTALARQARSHCRCSTPARRRSGRSAPRSASSSAGSCCAWSWGTRWTRGASCACWLSQGGAAAAA